MIPTPSSISKENAFLNTEEFKSEYAPKLNRVHFYVKGLRCSRCVHKIESLAQNVVGLDFVQVDLGRKIGFAQFRSAHIKFCELVDKARGFGFELIPISSPESQSFSQNSEDRQDIIRLAVAATCAGNIMTFSLAKYFGDTAELAGLFNALIFLFYLPVLTYVAWPFYKGATQSLVQRQVSIDLPMTVASIVGFVYSTYQLMIGGDQFYFDSISGFLFLILIARFFQKRLQRKFLKEDDLLESLCLNRIRKITQEGWEWALRKSLKKGDEVIVLKNDTIPIEGELMSAEACFSLAWLSGEVKSKRYREHGTICAGSKLLSDEAKIRMTKQLEDTEFGQIVYQSHRYLLSGNSLVGRADRWSRILITSVFSIAGLFMVVYWAVSPEEAVRRALALIVLACPCAMAFGAPLALSMSIKIARRKGLNIRNSEIFEKLGAIQNIFFDKTGTLTASELRLSESDHNIDRELKKVILSLENKSDHPIAFSFRSAFVDQGKLYTVNQFTEEPGVGVAGEINGDWYEIKSLAKQKATTGCALFKNQSLVHSFEFDSPVALEAKETLNALREKGFRVCLISGDNEEVTNLVAQKLGFAANDVWSGLSPLQKEGVVKAHSNSMFVGDGVNDSPAMMSAEVSVTTSGSTPAAVRSADVILVDRDLGGLLDLYQVSKDGRDLIQQNLVVSVVYNVLGGVAALLGYVNPLVAAVLMPISSGLILFSTWRRCRS